jgi:glycosyltransferase involved in cell wall biosynthesis
MTGAEPPPSGPSPRDALVLTLDPAMGGGVRTMQRAVCDAMERLGLRPHLAFVRSGRRERWDLRVHHVHADGRPARAVGYVPSLEFLNPLVPALRLREELARFEIVHVVCGVHSLGLVPALAGRPFVSWVATPFLDEIESRTKEPSVSVRVNHALRHLNRRIEGWTLRRSARVLALSTYTRRRLMERAGLPSADVPVLRCPVDTGRYHPEGPRWDAVAAPYLLSVGRVDDERKNYPALVRAFAGVATAHPELQLVVAGDVSPTSAVRRLATELGVADRVHLPGPLEGDVLASAYRGAELFVLTSRQEGLGIVVLEAQASGTPPLIMRCGGSDELIEDGVDGWLVDAGDEAAFVARLDAVLRDGSARAAAGQAARRKVEAEASPERFASELAHVYRRVWPSVHLGDGHP